MFVRALGGYKMKQERLDMLVHNAATLFGIAVNNPKKFPKPPSQTNVNGQAMSDKEIAARMSAMAKNKDINVSNNG
jgi:hypothetical protein